MHTSGFRPSNTTKIQREDTQRGKKERNFAAGEGKKKSEISGGPGEGRSREGPWKGGPGKGGPGKGGSGGTEHDQTKTLKPPHGNRETNTPATQAHTNTHKHTQTHTHTTTNIAKVGLAKVGLAKVGFWPNLAKVGHDRRRQGVRMPHGAELCGGSRMLRVRGVALLRD